MRKFRLGFPVVGADGRATGGIIYCGLKRKPHARVKFGPMGNRDLMEELDLENIFTGKYPVISDLIREIIHPEIDPHWELSLLYDGPGEMDEFVSGGRLSLQPFSAGAALEILTRIDELDAEGADADICVSANWANGKPLPLEDKKMLLEKLDICRQKGALLFICQQDLELLKQSFHNDELEKFEHPFWGSRDELESPESFSRAIRHYMSFPIPVNDRGEWSLEHGSRNAHPFGDGFARLLGFPVRSQIAKSTEIIGSPLKSPSGIGKNSPASLFIAAAGGSARLDHLQNLDGKGESYCKHLPAKCLGNLETLKKLIDDAPGFWHEPASKYKFLPNILISGPTSSGKTLLAQALLVNAVSVSRGALYIAPTRALVEEVWRKLRQMLPEDKTRLKIIRSTGEICDDDWRFLTGDFDIACIVNEKANVILPLQPNTVKRLGLVVVDELHMLTDEQRGGTLDMLLAKLKKRQKTQPYPRIVAISTEDSFSSAGPFVDYFKRGGDEYNDTLSPIVIRGEERPQKVAHKVVFCSPDGSIERDLVTFEKQSDRMLSKDKIARIRRECQSIAEIKMPALGRRSIPLSQLSTIILDLAERHNSFLVVGNRKDFLEKLCSVCADARLREDPAREAGRKDLARKISELREICDIPEELCKKWRRWAENGIFLHTADMPKKLREIIEAAFQSPTVFKPAPIVFCTETLNYGVNLHADGLALLSLNFPRSGTDAWDGVGLEERPLSHNQYHNILGRIGRFEMEPDITPAAYILLGLGRGNVFADIETLCQYYSEEACLKSKVFLRDDMAALEDDPESLEGFPTFMSFRSVMDALRMARQKDNESASAKDMENALKQTYFMFSQPPEKRKDWNSLARKILELSSCANFGNSLKLVECAPDETGSGKRYNLLKQGEALIDSGIHWKNIYPMAKWIETARKFEIPDPPGELLLPALLSCDEILANMLRSAMKSFKNNSDWLSPEKLALWEAKLDASLRERMGRVLENNKASSHNLDAIVSAIKNFASTTYGIKGVVRKVLGKDAQHHCHLFFMSVLCITLDWLEGKHIRMLDFTKNPAKNQPLTWHIPPNRFENISWAAQMCGNFFPAPENLTFNQVSNLALLALRLRKGVPLKDLPLTRGGLLDSGQLRQLRSKGLTADKILQFGGLPPNAQLEASWPPGKVLFENICRFYKDQYLLLQKRIARDWNENALLSDFMNGLFMDTRKANPDSFEEFANICRFKAEINVQFESVASDSGKECVLRFRLQGEENFIALLKEETPNNYCDAVCYLPWMPDRRVQNKPILTPGAVFALCHLPEEDAREFFDKTKERRDPRIVSANAILRDCAKKYYGMDALAILEPFSC